MRKQFALLLILLIIAAGATFALAYDVFGIVAPSGGWDGLLVFIGVGLFSQFLAIDFGTGKAANSSMAFIPFITGAVVFSPVLSIVNALAALVLSALLFEKRRWFVHVFNFAQTCVVVGGAALLYSTIVPTPGTAEIHFPAFVVVITVFFCGNMLLNSAGIAALYDARWVPTLRQMVGPLGANLWYDFLASPFAAVTALLYRDYDIVGVILSVFPLILLRHSYSSKQGLEKAIVALLNVLVKAIETRDPYTSGHSIRVANLAKQIGFDIGLSNRRAERLHMAALLHDIGKIDAEYATLICKPHDLAEDERILIRTHAARGAELLEGLSSLPPEVIAAVRHHHERCDGKGYPDGLAGDTIPLFARIIMICDSVDAMLSDRPYRKALSLDVVRAELQKYAGTQFDPDIVSVVLAKNTLEKAQLAVHISDGAGSREPAATTAASV